MQCKQKLLRCALLTLDIFSTEIVCRVVIVIQYLKHLYNANALSVWLKVLYHSLMFYQKLPVWRYIHHRATTDDIKPFLRTLPFNSQFSYHPYIRQIRHEMLLYQGGLKIDTRAV